MIENLFTIDCAKFYSETHRTKPFQVIKFVLDYEKYTGDQILIDRLCKEADNLASKVNPHAANNSTIERDIFRRKANCLAGVISEYFWNYYLNDGIPGKIVRKTKFTDVSKQIDIEIVSNSKRIEVRSSFPRNGVTFAICNPHYEFNIVGSYNNSYKPGEVRKDYYVLCLFEFEYPEKILDAIKKPNFNIFLTGGSTYEMMHDSNISKQSSLLPDDTLYDNEVATNYRVVPLSKALDTIEIYNLIHAEK